VSDPAIADKIRKMNQRVRWQDPAIVERGIDPVDVRWLMFSVHYGSRLNFTFAGLEAGRKARLRLQDYIYDLWERAHSLGNSANGAEHQSTLATPLRTAVFSELANDLQTPKALADLFTFVNHNSASTLEPEAAAAARAATRRKRRRGRHERDGTNQ